MSTGEHMTQHRDTFFKFIDDMNTSEVRYVLLRGFAKLPDKPDTDIDFLVHHEDWDRYAEVALRHLSQDPGEPLNNFGFAEWADMLYWPLFTRGPHDSSIPNGRFRVDSYNTPHFDSPYNNFAGKWTLPEAFNESLFDTMQQIPALDTFYNVPSTENEIVLLVARDVLDLRGRWKGKHQDRVNKLLVNLSDDGLVEAINGVFPNGAKIVEAMRRNDYESIFNLAMGT